MVVEFLLIAVSLAMDALAVSISKGLASSTHRLKIAFACGVWFGFFQFLMPLLGYLLGTTFIGYVQSISKWVAAGILAVVGAHMFVAADDDDENTDGDSIKPIVMFFCAVATSIDAFAVGISFATLNVDVLLGSIIIGVVTFVLSFVGVFVGAQFQNLLGKRAEQAGGVVLALIAIKILVIG